MPKLFGSLTRVRVLLLVAGALCPDRAHASTRAEIPRGGEAAGNRPATSSQPAPGAFAGCAQPLAPLPGIDRQGEHIEYDVKLINLAVGTVVVTTVRRGRFAGELVTEYRGEMRLDGLVDTFVHLDAAAAALVTDAFAPIHAMHRYHLAATSISELQSFSDGGREVVSRTRDGDGERHGRQRFQAPVQDLLTGFYFLRRLPPEASGCSIIAAEGRGYTVWLTPEGRDHVDTPFGRREATRYYLRYGGDDGRFIKDARVWIGTDPMHIPYRIEVLTRYHPVIAIKRYRPPG